MRHDVKVCILCCLCSWHSGPSTCWRENKRKSYIKIHPHFTSFLHIEGLLFGNVLFDILSVLFLRHFELLLSQKTSLFHWFVCLFVTSPDLQHLLCFSTRKWQTTPSQLGITFLLECTKCGIGRGGLWCLSELFLGSFYRYSFLLTVYLYLCHVKLLYLSTETQMNPCCELIDLLIVVFPVVVNACFWALSRRLRRPRIAFSLESYFLVCLFFSVQASIGFCFLSCFFPQKRFLFF